MNYQTKKTIKVDIYQSFLSHNDSYYLLSYDTYNHSNGKQPFHY